MRAATKSHPELVSTFLSLRGAQAIAERRIADRKDRERFLALVREAIAKSIHHGDPIPEIDLREPTPTTREEDTPERAPKPVEPAR
jgi:hypothetical protein